MKPISLSTIAPGTEAPGDLYSQKGELLVSKGVVITDRHLDMLTRRNIFEVFLKPVDEHEELQSLLSREIQQLGDLELRDDAKRSSPVTVKPGKDGLDELGRSEVAADVDRRIREGRSPDRPFGKSLESKAVAPTPAGRAVEYKQTMRTQYHEALVETAHLLNALADGSLTDGKRVRYVTERFVKIYVTDRNILLNLSSIKAPPGGDFLYTHSLNVCLLSINIAAAYGYNENQVIEIGMGALVHDVGMLHVPQHIRLKAGKLATDEWYEVQKHPILGLHILEKVKNLPETVPYISYQVHERENAQGYPKQRGSKLIHRFAKLVQVADVYEAMSSPRPHREPLIPYKAMESVVKMTRTGLISEEFVKSFLAYASLFPVGSLVQLSSNRAARVVAANKESFSKPVVTVLTDASGHLLPPHLMYQIDLCRDRDIQIVKAISGDHFKDLDLMDGF